ncbi:MAG: hypothetical protein KBC26_01700 [Candidatus Pacebacteria bacterium]|nr:hypothetical protein [Candidatus Paceibacterota bacterium]
MLEPFSKKDERKEVARAERVVVRRFSYAPRRIPPRLARRYDSPVFYFCIFVAALFAFLFL